jgi:uroporphyrin-3 C-methyltransferase
VAALLAVITGVWLDGRARVAVLEQQVARRLAEADAYNQESRQIANRARETLGDMEYKVGLLESRLAETQNQRLALEALYLELSRSKDERVLAEIEQTLLAGNQQLQLAGNVKSALLALETADTRLAHIEGTQFRGLRRAIRHDIDRLKAAPFVDVLAMSQRLDTLAHQSDEFPLAMDLRPAETPPAAEGEPKGSLPARWARETVNALLGLVRIQRVDVRDVPVLAPSQAFFLRENLRMRLLSARIALLAHDEAGFHADTRSASEWLRRYYDARDKRVGMALDALRQLSESRLSIDLPDISTSLEAVRNARLVRERGLR